jgi:hypothetical protein
MCRRKTFRTSNFSANYRSYIRNGFSFLIRGPARIVKRKKLTIKNLVTFSLQQPISRHLYVSLCALITVPKKQCCGSEKIFFGFGSKIFFFGFGVGYGFFTSGKGTINFLKYRQSVFHEDVLTKLKFLPA